MPENMKIDFIGMNKTIKYLDGVKRKIKSSRVTNKKAAIVMQAWIKRNFITEGGMHENSSLNWKPLKPETIKRRRKGPGKGSDKILRDTDNLMNRWTIMADERKAILKSQQDYSAVHEFGTSKVPKRKIFPTQIQGVKIVKPVYDKFIEESIQ